MGQIEPYAGSILLVEDDDLLCWSIRRFLESRGFSVDVAADGTEGLRKAATASYDLLVTDLKIRGIDGLRLAAEARTHCPSLQVVIITGHGSKNTVIRALRQGVWDFVEKPFDLELLLITIEKALEKKRMERELVRLSRTDGLTGLYNQRHFYSLLADEMKRSSRQKKRLSLILVDVDDFKQYNDRRGHLAGDDLLMRLAGCLRKACRSDVDQAFRYGGDEFVLLLPEADESIARAVAGRIAGFIGEEKLEVTVSIGLTEVEGGGELRQVIREADEAMYLAKQFGGNRTVAFDKAR